MPLFLIFFVAIIAATTSKSWLSQELELPNGTVLQARDIKRYHLPFTSTWLQRSVELLEVSNDNTTKILHRVSSLELPPNGAMMHPQIEFKEPNQLNILLLNAESRKVETTFVFPLNNHD